MYDKGQTLGPNTEMNDDTWHKNFYNFQSNGHLVKSKQNNILSAIDQELSGVRSLPLLHNDLHCSFNEAVQTPLPQ